MGEAILREIFLRLQLLIHIDLQFGANGERRAQVPVVDPDIACGVGAEFV
jgi:hypothetical protein